MSLLDDEKLFYERFNNLHGDPVLLGIFQRFGISVFRRSSVLEGFAQFIEANNFRGKTCVEIGTCKGLTALVLSRFFDTVVSVDIVADHQRNEIAEFVGVKNVHFMTVANNYEKADLLDKLVFDAAYADGDHAQDTMLDFSLVRKCGRVLFHEYWEVQPEVMRLVSRLAKQGHVVTSGKFALWTAS